MIHALLRLLNDLAKRFQSPINSIFIKFDNAGGIVEMELTSTRGVALDVKKVNATSKRKAKLIKKC